MEALGKGVGTQRLRLTQIKFLNYQKRFSKILTKADIFFAFDLESLIISGLCLVNCPDFSLTAIIYHNLIIFESHL